MGGHNSRLLERLRLADLSSKSPFVRCLLASGLLSPAQVQETLRDLPADADDQQVADRFVEVGQINAWQAHQLLNGRAKFNLGPYWMVDAIGQGGMGQVFKARRGLDGPEVAVKVLPRSKSSPEAVAYFAREIAALSRLNHENLVQALDHGHDGNVYFLVTEYVPGEDLRKLVRRTGPLDMRQAARVISQVALGLQHAHEQELIHRDVKPGNVLVTPDGKAKLLDLGLAGSSDSNATNDPRHGKIVGTVDYLAPDQIRRPTEPHPSWDIYSLGCSLYYAVTGKVPFPGGSIMEKARAHCEATPLDPRRLNPQLAEEFCDVIADMMAKRPSARIQSAEEVVARLAPWSGMRVRAEVLQAAEARRAELAEARARATNVARTESYPELAGLIVAPPPDAAADLAWIEGPVVPGEQHWRLPPVTNAVGSTLLFVVVPTALAALAATAALLIAKLAS